MKHPRELEDKFDYLLENYTLEEILEFSDLTPLQALIILFLEGHIDLDATPLVS